MSDHSERFSARARRTRRAILDAAEPLFAARGFAATRLEDVAAEVGVRRASLLYYFPDKRALYDAVLDGLFGGLLEAIRPALCAPGPMRERALRAVEAWVDFVGAHPALARLLLREVANAAPDRSPPLQRHTRAFAELVEKVMRESPGDPLLAPLLHEDLRPAHVASTIAGATVFFVAGMPALLPDLGFDPASGAPLEEHRRAILHIARRLLDAEEAP